VIAALSEDPGASALEVAEAVLLTSLVLWLAHVYADLVAEGAAGVRISTTRVREAMVHGSPILQACVLPIVVLALGAIGVLEDRAALSTAIGVGVVYLFFWGLLAGRRQGHGPVVRVLVGGASAGLGLLIVGLKVLVH
jgi:hypothetical protein